MNKEEKEEAITINDMFVLADAKEHRLPPWYKNPDWDGELPPEWHALDKVINDDTLVGVYLEILHRLEKKIYGYIRSDIYQTVEAQQELLSKLSKENMRLIGKLNKIVQLIRDDA